MQPKLFLMLAVTVLLAALLCGNPFLGKGCQGADPAVPLEAAPPATPAAEAVVPAVFETNRSGPREWSEGRVPAAAPGDHGRALPAALVVDQTEPIDLAKGTMGKAVAPQCPDPLLRPFCVDVEVDASGAATWVLEDGRRFCRNPVAGKEPLLVPAPPRKSKGR